MPDNTSPKRNEPLLFEVQLNLLPDQRGILTANDVKGIINISVPPEFGGPGNNWSPEHLFLCSISSCFMTTLQFFAKGLEIQDFKAEAIGKVERIRGHYEFTQIDLYPIVYIADERNMEETKTALAKTQEYCLISHSIKCQIIYHSQVSLAKKVD